MTETSATHRGVLFLTLLTIVCGGLLRLGSLGDIGIDHFDAGAYAESATAVRDSSNKSLFPRQHFLSPMLFFSLGGFLSGLTGMPVDESLVWVSAVFGTLCILCVFGLTRLWLGAREGLFAALIIGLSIHHIALSRTALTDATFCTLFLVALLLHFMAHRRQSWWLTVAAGVAIGLAWNTKYHGWLVGVIAAAATLPDFMGGDGAARRRILMRHALATIVAVACYAPWFIYICDQPGGYGALAAEHRRFLSDAGRFLAHTARHLESWRFFDGPLTHVALALGLMVIAKGRWRENAVLLGVCLAGSFITSAATVLVGLAVVGAVAAITRGEWKTRSWPLAFFGLFCLLTPLYRPYNRLSMPLILSAAILAPVGAAVLVQALRRQTPAIHSLVVGLSIVLVLSLGHSENRGTEVNRNFDGMRSASQDMAKEVEKRELTQPVYVVGEPPVVHYLNRAGIAAIAINELKEITERPATFVMGIYATRTPTNRDFVDKMRDRLALISTQAVEVSDIRLLDDFAPTESWDFRRENHRPHSLSLYELR